MNNSCKPGDKRIHSFKVTKDHFPSFEEQIAVVNNTLKEIGALDKPMILVFNKTDQIKSLEDGSMPSPKHLVANGNISNIKAIYISAIKKENVDKLRKSILKEVRKVHGTIFPNYLQHND